MLKNFVTVAIVTLLLQTPGMGQAATVRPHDSAFGTYYAQRVSLFRLLPAQPGDILFAGNSLTDGGEWSELFGDMRIKNRGISGDRTAGVLHRLDELTARHPAKLFLLIGVNDLAGNTPADSVTANILRIATSVRQQSPGTRLYVQSLLPVNNSFPRFTGHTSKTKEIEQVNKALQSQATGLGFTYVDLYSAFAGNDGRLNARYTNDGLHLNGAGYMLWKHTVYPYVYDVPVLPALIPLPQQVQWQTGQFELYNCTAIVNNRKELKTEALYLQQMLEQKGLRLQVRDKAVDAEPAIYLNLATVAAPQQQHEAYRLQVSNNQIELTANTTTGMRHAIETLRQLLRDGAITDACTITDWPQHPWRGFMIDVGRNYASPSMLKQIIDRMGQYKLNVFHLHATEDIAWRFPSAKYPQLNSPEHMLRNKGMYYTATELHDLINYCAARHITLVPEIDMPGHSAAFTRAMGTDMQSDTGLTYVKEILKEFVATFKPPIMHIGGDEVKVRNSRFMPEVTALLHSLGVKTVGWQPGANLDTATIRQLWMDDAGKAGSASRVQVIDSRHLYLNHMDPLESVATIWSRRLGGDQRQDQQVLGATLCLWHDRAVARQEDQLTMNPVYPGMLAFAERAWLGGGQSKWTATLPIEGSDAAAAFEAFEDRLLAHRTCFFDDDPFAYVRQSKLHWKLYGPFANGGNLTQAFAPEQPGFDTANKPAATARGATVVLRHWWAPAITGALPQPQENTTWYATTTLWSPVAGYKPFWIGFNNLSRSPATNSPPAGAWNTLQSALWVNGQLVPPPVWTRAGQQGHSEIPLTDEGYEYRPPTLLWLHAGWNTVLVKLPVGSFKGPDWQNPVKWMFTFCEAPNGYYPEH